MNTQPKIIGLDKIAEVIAEKFKTKDEITCYVGSNAATPTASLTALTDAIKLRRPRLPFLKMVHLLLIMPKWSLRRWMAACRLPGDKAWWTPNPLII